MLFDRRSAALCAVKPCRFLFLSLVMIERRSEVFDVVVTWDIMLFVVGFEFLKRGEKLALEIVIVLVGAKFDDGRNHRFVGMFSEEHTKDIRQRVFGCDGE